MGNVKKVCQSLIPILLLPFLGSLAQNALTLLVSQKMGSFYLTADSVTQKIFSLAAVPLYLTALAGAFLPAVRTEEDHAEAGKAVHRRALIAFCALVALTAAALLLLGNALLKLFVSPEEIIAIGVPSLRIGALSMLGTALISGVIGQTGNDSSWKAVFAFGAVLTVLWAALGYVAVIRTGMTGLGLSRGGVFAATRIAPFLMLPLKSYANGFRPVRPEV